MPASAVRIVPAASPDLPGVIEDLGQLKPRPSGLRPPCRADERIFQWKGVNTPPPSTVDHPIIRHLADTASRASLSDSTSYGSALRKYHLFCDVFSVPEAARLPAAYSLLHSFALWAAADPDPADPVFADGTPFEPVSVPVVRKYLAGVRAWHIAQGWPAPLSDEDHARINWSLRGLAKMQLGKRTRPPRPPATLPMLVALKATLDLSDSFDACVWAMASCAFWGLMRFGEVSVKSRSAFDPALHLKRCDSTSGVDLDGVPYICLHLPSAKTAAPGEIQKVYLTEQGNLCPIAALRNLATVVPALADDPLFSWRDRQGEIRPMVRQAALTRINTVFQAWGWGNAFGHSFRIGGASYLLAKKVDPEIVRIAGRWRSLAYELYIRSFELVIGSHVANIASAGTRSGQNAT